MIFIHACGLRILALYSNHRLLGAGFQFECRHRLLADRSGAGWKRRSHTSTSTDGETWRKLLAAFLAWGETTFFFFSFFFPRQFSDFSTCVKRKILLYVYFRFGLFLRASPVPLREISKPPLSSFYHLKKCLFMVTLNWLCSIPPPPPPPPPTFPGLRFLSFRTPLSLCLSHSHFGDRLRTILFWHVNEFQS